MVLTVISCATLILSACLALTVGADCGADCAYCTVHLRLQRTDLNSIACVLECEGQLEAESSWNLCQNVLQTTVSSAEGDQVSTEAVRQDIQSHPLEKKYGGFMKKYGGFMKRYGGFMKRYGGFMKKTAEIYGVEPEDMDHGKILTSHDLEILSNQIAEDAQREEGGHANSEESVAKRYGGFMQRGGAYSFEGGVKPLQKRYGGFMRRVGRPEWGEESKRYGGFLKRSQSEGEEEQDKLSEVDKRYGGFMDY